MSVKEIFLEFFVEKDVEVQDRVFTVPNLITGLGIFLTFFYVLMYVGDWHTSWIPLVVVLVVVSDLLDGLAARQFNQHTTLGKLIDPFRDRLLEFAVIGNILFSDPSGVNVYIAVSIGIFEFLIFALKNKMRKESTSGGFTHTLGKVRLAIHMLCAGIFVAGAYLVSSQEMFSWIRIFNETQLLTVMLVASAMAFGAYLGHYKNNFVNKN
ncbi:MAG: CDP-alcohol phosphatidyltransferase family protein [Candidatus Spechtbacterales bacterium]|nr:CDP-alcohol phosphatidyltransferase family protein [Candidatus Spechtbacterales bacterium]